VSRATTVENGACTYITGSLVPPQTPESVNPLVISHLEKEFDKLKSKNKLNIRVFPGASKPWSEDWKHWNYQAASRATELIYGKTPDLTRGGGGIPVLLTFSEILKVNIVLLPMGRGDDGAQCAFYYFYQCQVTEDDPPAQRTRSLIGLILSKGQVVFRSSLDSAPNMLRTDEALGYLPL
jgi:hypothetical protein